MRGLRLIVALVAAAALAAGCADEDPAAEEPAGPAAGGSTGGSTGGAQTGGSARSVWPVGDAGDVEVSAAGGRLRLVAVRPGAGWSETVEDEGPDAVVVHLRRPGAGWTFRAALAGGALDVVVTGERRNAAPGAIPLGDAGTVMIRVGPGRSLAVASTSTSGWSVSTVTRGDEGEVVLARGPARWRLSIARGTDGLRLAYEYRDRGPAGG